MKLSIPLALLSATSALAFTPSAPSTAFLAKSASSTSAIFASKNQKKIISRDKWADSKGVVTADAEASVSNILKNADGLEYVKLTSGSSSSEIYLMGGVVTSYVKDDVEYIAVRPDAKMDGSKPISGGLSHCWPQFGPGEIQQHGFARNVNWSVVSVDDSSVELELLPSDYTKAMWDKDFKCTFTVTLNDDQLDTKMNVQNCGDEAFDFQAALHSYFAVSSLENLEITGSFQGKEFLNKMVGEGEMQTEDRASITISEEYDRVYKGVNDPVIKDSGKGKKLNVMNTAGWEDTVLWNPYGDEGMGFNQFVCVESAKFDPVTLEGGSNWVGDLSLKPEDL
jgi:glucose-6-phosphate 1-epimerase